MKLVITLKQRTSEEKNQIWKEENKLYSVYVAIWQSYARMRLRLSSTQSRNLTKHSFPGNRVMINMCIENRTVLDLDWSRLETKLSKMLAKSYIRKIKETD